MFQVILRRIIFSSVLSASFLLGCSNQTKTSEAELQVLQSTALSQSFNANDHVGGVYSLKDSLPASRPFHVNSITESIQIPVRDCTTPGLYEMEKQMALNLAAGDPTGQTVPVKFSYSFGRKHDGLAKAANKRAVLSESNGGISYIPVGDKTRSKYGNKHAYYEVDNQEVARQYSQGEKCFFSTIEIKPENFHSMKGYYDFIEVTDEDLILSANLLKSKKTSDAKKKYLKHMIHYMYYGYCKMGVCSDQQAFAGEYANRLFQEVPSIENDEPQIIKLYMADLRSEQMAHDIVRLSEDTTRGLEIDSTINNILNICKVHKNYFDVTKNLSLPKEVNGYEFDPIKGAVQLVNNILSHDVDGTMLSSQYTPIVIDLDGDGIKTSSVRWGTYFNMAALENNQGIGQNHRTAWLGGDYVDVNSDPRVNMDVRLQSNDGFLVIPNDGQVTSSTQMFGDNMTVAGQSYENGFQALQAFAGKTCSSDEIRNRYVGPWDGDIYENQLKVWVDRNRNGVSEEGEILSLREAKIAAINACHIVHQEETDLFGNGTQLRSAVLMTGPYLQLLDRPDEILYQLQYGEGYEGEDTYFHLAIDLIFKVDEEDRCAGAALTSIDYPGLGTNDDTGPVGIPSNDPEPLPAPLPPTPPQRPDNF